MLVFRELDKILKNCIPKRSVFFAFDGPAPMAKLLTQRRRRCTERQKGKLIKTRGKSTRAGKVPLDRLQFTPGVELLYYLRDSMLYWTHSRLQNDRKYQGVEFFISGPDVAGEGELKIVDFCRNGFVRSGDSVVVIGGDADIVLQGLTTTTLQNFLVFLPPSGPKKKKRVNSYVSVWEVCRSFERLFPGENSAVRLDFVILSMLQGNDYLPKVRGISLPRLWRRYIKLKAPRKGTRSKAPFAGQYIINADTRTFNWAFLHSLMLHTGYEVPEISGGSTAGNTANTAAPSAAPSRKENESDWGEDIVVYTGNEDGQYLDPVDEGEEESAVDDDDEDESEETGDDWEEGESDEEGFGDIDEDEAHIENLVAISGSNTKHYDTERYLRTLLWTLQMYIDGHCSDYSFSYNKPYAPSCAVIRKFIEDNGGDPFEVQAPVSNAPALLPHQAAMAMLPQSAAKFLPKPMQAIVADPKLARDIFLPRHKINVVAMLNAIEKVPMSAYSADELRRMRFGTPIQIRLPRGRDRRPAPRTPMYRPPGGRFAPLKVMPVIFMATFPMTTLPPCLPWPKGGVTGLLSKAYKRVGGAAEVRVSPKRGRSAGPSGGANGAAGENGGGPKPRQRRRPPRRNGPRNAQKAPVNGGDKT